MVMDILRVKNLILPHLHLYIFPRRLIFYHYLSAHILVAFTTKDIAEEHKSAALHRSKTHAGNLAGSDVGTDAQWRAIKPVKSVERRQFQDNGHTFFYSDLAGTIFKLFGRNFDHLFRLLCK